MDALGKEGEKYTPNEQTDREADQIITDGTKKESDRITNSESGKKSCTNCQ